jgi:hypothetical protein
MIISIIIGIYAAHISYAYNTKHNLSETNKIISAIFAFLFGLFYLIYYFLVTADEDK